MRSQVKWAKKHRAGERRARAIVQRQDRVNPLPIPQDPIRYPTDRERARRRRQIESGQLTVSNGLVD